MRPNQKIVDETSRQKVSNVIRDTLFEFTMTYLLDVPDDLESHARKFFNSIRPKQTTMEYQPHVSICSDESISESSSSSCKHRTRRRVVCGESYDPAADKEAFVKPVYTKTQEERATLEKVVRNTIIFKALEDAEIQDIVNAMFKRQTNPGDFIIRQGEGGDNFYVIERGTFDVLQAKPGQKPQRISSYKESGHFGELALLYNQPRAATVVASTKGVIWALDRNTFRKLVIKAAHEKKVMNEKFVSEVPVLTHMGSFERNIIAHELSMKNFQEDEIIYKAGDTVDGIYFVYTGCVNMKVKNKLGVVVELDHLKKFDYFGELEIIEGYTRRMTTVHAVAPSRLAFLNLEAFKSHMGHCMEQMKVRSENIKLRLKRTVGFLDENLRAFEDFVGAECESSTSTESSTTVKSSSSNDSVPVVRGRERRGVVYGESYDPTAVHDDFVKIVHPKTDEERDTLEQIAKKTLLFRALDEEQLNDVINAMFKKETHPGEIIIRQGDDGDNFYVIEYGIYDAFVSKSGEEQEHVFTYENEGNFGELALLYNQPRAATVIAKSDGVIWGLERNTFRQLVLQSEFKKRETYEQFIRTVPMLTELGDAERMQIADVLVPKKFKEGELIFKQGDKGDGMYFVMAGSVVIKLIVKGGGEIELDKIGEGGYFGEIALIEDRPRTASVYAAEDTKLAFLDTGAFERFMGPCVEVMERNVELYESHMKKITESFFV